MSHSYSLKLADSYYGERKVSEEIKEAFANGYDYGLRQNYIPYQICPICMGSGVRPVRLSNGTEFPCDVCNGKKIIPMYFNELKEGGR